jgi:hypothetical protein
MDCRQFAWVSRYFFGEHLVERFGVLLIKTQIADGHHAAEYFFMKALVGAIDPIDVASVIF